jgi:hypothetical protein
LNGNWQKQRQKHRRGIPSSSAATVKCRIGGELTEDEECLLACFLLLWIWNGRRLFIGEKGSKGAYGFSSDPPGDKDRGMGGGQLTLLAMAHTIVVPPPPIVADVGWGGGSSTI